MKWRVAAALAVAGLAVFLGTSRGSSKVYRGPADGSQTLVRTISAGQAGSIGPGEWLVETPSVWHAGGNRGTKPVEILLAALLSSKQPVAIPVKP